ncbi:MAG: hypothetical protein IPK55_11935, partial [Streptococcus sp.]|nr:hypothetical protein [Streptococcus sp.]
MELQFHGCEFTENLKFNLILGNPYDFYHEIHRPSHFLDFS